MSKAILGVLILVTMSLPSRSEALSSKDVKACDSIADPRARVAGCSRILSENKRLPSKILYQLHLQRGQGYSRLKEYGQALEDYDLALKYQPDSFAALSDRADAFNATGNYAAAADDAGRALRLNSRYPLAYNAMGLAEYHMGQNDRAIDFFTKGIALPEKLDALYTNRGSAWLAKGENDFALTDLDAAIKMNGSNALAYSNRCSALSRKEKYSDAISDCSKAIQIDPNSASAYLNRGDASFSIGNVDQSLADLDKSIRLYPRSAGSYALRSNIWIHKGRLDKALADVNQAIAIEPKIAASFVSKGKILEAKGDSDAARSAYRQALSLPDRVMIITPYGVFAESSTTERKTAEARLLALGMVGPLPSGQALTAGAAIETTGRRIALVIGNGAYINAGRLSNPSNDARLIANSLRSMKFEVAENIDLDRLSMERAIADFIRAAATASQTVLFFAGHGVQIGGQNYLLPIDTKLDVDDLKRELMALDTILAGLDDKLRANIVILDACRNDPDIQDASDSEIGRSAKIRSGLASPAGTAKGGTPGSGTLLAFATAPGQYALDGDGSNSPFSVALGRHIDTPGLEVQQMLTRVRAEVVASTAAKQIPWSNSSLLGDVYLRAKP